MIFSIDLKNITRKSTDLLCGHCGRDTMGIHHASKCDNLQKLDIKLDTSEDGFWFVYHKDLKNSARIQALFGFLEQSLGKS